MLAPNGIPYFALIIGSTHLHSNGLTQFALIILCAALLPQEGEDAQFIDAVVALEGLRLADGPLAARSGPGLPHHLPSQQQHQQPQGAGYGGGGNGGPTLAQQVLFASGSHLRSL